MILVVAEQREGAVNRTSWEAVAAAQAIGDPPVKIAVVGTTVGAVASELAAADVAEVISVEDAALEPYTPDGYVQALSQLIEREEPKVVIFSHTYQARDFVPKLAALGASISRT